MKWTSLCMLFWLGCCGFVDVDFGQPDWVETRTLQVPAVDIQTLVIDAGAGRMEIRGEPDADRIEVTATIELFHRGRAVRRSDVDRIVDLYLERSGSKAYLRATTRSYRGWFRRVWGRIHLFVRVPESLNLDIDDGSGPIEIAHIRGAITIDDGSGSIQANDVGAITIDDGSGRIELSGVRGNIEIRDGSGAITIVDVVGNVEIHDGSGNIDVQQVDGSIDIWDGSGAIIIRHVTRDVDLHAVGSGGVSIEDVRGRVRTAD